MDWEAQFFWWTINDVQYTEFDTFVEFQEELFQYHENIAREVGLQVAWRTLCLNT